MAQPEGDRRCPRCGTPYNEGQEYCLECGERLPARPSLATGLGARWRRHLGWYPGDWIWPALLALVVAIVAGVVSAVWLADDSSSASDTVVRTQVGSGSRVAPAALIGDDEIIPPGTEIATDPRGLRLAA